MKFVFFPHTFKFNFCIKYETGDTFRTDYYYYAYALSYLSNLSVLPPENKNNGNYHLFEIN